jgi:hypothetical protein
MAWVLIMRAQEATSRALAQASTPYQQSGTRVDITAPRRILAGTRVRLWNPNYETVGQIGTLVGDGHEKSYRVWTIDIGTFRYRNEGYIERA